MKKEYVAIITVVAAACSATWLLEGTGTLTGFTGVFLRVLIGYGALLLAMQLACRLDFGKAGERG